MQLDATGWARFGVGAGEVKRLMRYVRREAARLARRHPDPETVRGDVEGEMWLKALRILDGDPLYDRKKLRTAMYRAGCDCVSRQLEDAPRLGGRRSKDPTKMASYEEVFR